MCDEESFFFFVVTFDSAPFARTSSQKFIRVCKKPAKRARGVWVAKPLIVDLSIHRILFRDPAGFVKLYRH